LSTSLVSGLRRLSRRDREALLLLAWGELGYAEIPAR
jgi:DNA-directed RNA polymerase specialized sigma24 family protein